MQVDQKGQISSGVGGLLCAGHLAVPSRGRLERQEACPEAVLGARRPVLSARRRTQGRLERQACPEARRPVWRLSGAPRAPSAGRRGRQEAENVGFADSSSENEGFVGLGPGALQK